MIVQFFGSSLRHCIKTPEQWEGTTCWLLGHQGNGLITSTSGSTSCGPKQPLSCPISLPSDQLPVLSRINSAMMKRPTKKFPEHRTMSVCDCSTCCQVWTQWLGHQSCRAERIVPVYSEPGSLMGQHVNHQAELVTTHTSCSNILDIV